MIYHTRDFGNRHIIIWPILVMSTYQRDGSFGLLVALLFDFLRIVTIAP